MLIVVLLNAAKLSVIMLSDVKLNIFMLRLCQECCYIMSKANKILQTNINLVITRHSFS